MNVYICVCQNFCALNVYNWRKHLQGAEYKKEQNMNTHMCVCVLCVCIYMYMLIRIYIDMKICIQISISIYKDICTCIHIYT